MRCRPNFHGAYVLLEGKAKSRCPRPMKTGRDKHYQSTLKEVNRDDGGAVLDRLVKEEHSEKEVRKRALCPSLERH